MINYKSGDLFKGSTEGSYKVHACNCKGSWGSGIAKTFKEYYPKTFEEYKKDCDYLSNTLLGSCMIYDSKVVALFTSKDFGHNVDSVKDILENTEKAFRCLLHKINLDSNTDTNTISMPRINSGLFKVPWGDTEKVLYKVLKEYYNTVYNAKSIKIDVYTL